MTDKTLLIFDWDGTLVDSLANIAHCMQVAAVDLGIEPVSVAEVHSIVGLSLELAIARLHPALDAAGVEAMRQQYAEHFIAVEQNPSPFFPGIEAMLTGLRQRQCYLSVATGKSRRGLDRVFERLGGQRWFHSSRCSDETQSKPDPTMVHELLALHEVAPEQALLIGDTTFDLEMAQRAGVDSIGVAWGAHSLDQLQSCAPIACVRQVSQLNDWLIRQTSL